MSLRRDHSEELSRGEPCPHWQFKTRARSMKVDSRQSHTTSHWIHEFTYVRVNALIGRMDQQLLFRGNEHIPIWTQYQIHSDNPAERSGIYLILSIAKHLIKRRQKVNDKPAFNILFRSPLSDLSKAFENYFGKLSFTVRITWFYTVPIVF